MHAHVSPYSQTREGDYSPGMTGSRKRRRSSRSYSVSEEEDDALSSDVSEDASEVSVGDESEYSGESDVSSNDGNDLRGFIDFNPKFNKARVSKRTKDSGESDELYKFLFEPSKTRKWFKRLTQTAVGAKLVKKGPCN